MKTILLADDEIHLRLLVRTTLEDPCYRILEAANGHEAYTLAQQERPDLVILDWMMPGMSGLQVAKTLRQHPDTADIPIIMLSAKGQETDKLQAEAAGVAAYLAKPFSPLELLEQIQTLLAPATAAEES